MNLSGRLCLRSLLCSFSAVWLLCWTVACTAPSAAGTTAGDAYASAQASAAEHDCRQAIELYRIALQRDPRFIAALEGIASCAQSAGDYATARAADTQAISIDAEKYQLYRNRGALEGQEGDSAVAIADELTAARLAAPSVNAYSAIAQVLAGQSDYNDALRIITKAIVLDPRGASLYVMRGDWHRSEGNFRGAEADYTDALRIARGSSARAAVLAAAAALYDQRHRHDAAAYAIEQAIGLEPTDSTYYALAGSILANGDRLPDAAAAYVKAIKYAADRPAADQARVALGDIYAKLGRDRDAIRQYDLVIGASRNVDLRNAIEAHISRLRTSSDLRK